jgi:hypothetical protein
MRWLDLFDMSAYLDAGYRIASGQRFYKDFYYHAGPLDACLHAFFFTLFGFNKTAILIHMCAGASVAAAVTFFIARKEFSALRSSGLAFLTGLIFYGPISQPWHDQNAMAWILGAYAIFYLRTKYRISSAASCGVLIAFSFLTKPNFGAAAAVCFGVLFLFLRSWEELRAFVIGGVVGAGLTIVTLTEATQYVENSFVHYHATNRLVDLGRLKQVFIYNPSTALLFVSLILWVAGGKKFVKTQKEIIALFISLIFINVFSAWSGAMVIPSNICALGLAVTFLCIAFSRFQKSTPNKRFVRVSYALCSLTLAAASFYSVIATDCLLSWTWRGHAARSSYEFKTPSMRGWKCDPTVCPGVDKVVAYLETNVPKTDTLFVFPDALIIYALSGHQSFLHAPIYWQRPYEGAEAPLEGPFYDNFRNSFLKQPPQWIVIHNQTEVPLFDTAATLDWLQLNGWIQSNSVKVWGESNFEIRKTEERKG